MDTVTPSSLNFPALPPHPLLSAWPLSTFPGIGPAPLRRAIAPLRRPDRPRQSPRTRGGSETGTPQALERCSTPARLRPAPRPRRRAGRPPAFSFQRSTKAPKRRRFPSGLTAAKPKLSRAGLRGGPQGEPKSRLDFADLPNAMPGGLEPAMSRRQVIALFLVGLVAGFAVLARVIHHREPPYRMTLRRVDGQTVVQFTRPGRRLVSPEFPVNLPLADPQVVELHSDDVPIHGCVVEFHDTTLLPGRFRIRIGDRLFDVMERGIEAGGKKVDWEPLRADATQSATQPASAALP